LKQASTPNMIHVILAQGLQKYDMILW